MRTAYDILLSLSVNHLYFPDKVFEGFEFVADKKTTNLINQNKLVTKKKGNNWNLFFQTEGPFSTSLAELVSKEFVFAVKITDPFFFSITDPSYLPGADEMLLFNAPLNSVIIPEKRKVYPLKFKYTIHHQARPVLIKVTNAKGTDVFSHLLLDPQVKEEEVDLTTEGENVYDIVEDTIPPGGHESEMIYAKEEITAGFFYGIVYFKILFVNGQSTANQYRIDFESN